MEFDKQKLVEALGKVECGLAGCSGPNADAFNCFRFAPGRIFTFNNDIAASVEFPHDLDCTVPAAELKKLLTKTKGTNIALEVTEKELRITGGKFEAGLALREEFKLPPGMYVEEKDMSPVPAGFLPALQACIPSIYPNKDRIELSVLHVTPKFAESCDVHRVTRFFWDDDTPMPGDMLFPVQVAKELARHKLSHVFMDEDGAVFLDALGVRIYAKTMDIQYPDLSKWIDTEGPEVEFPAGMKDILERADIFCEGDNAAYQAILIFEDGKMTVCAQNSGGWFRETARIIFKHDRVVFGFIPKLMMEILSRSTTFVLGPDRLRFDTEQMIHLAAISDCSQEELDKYIKRR